MPPASAAWRRPRRRAGRALRGAFSDVEWRRTHTMIHLNSIMMSIVVALLARCIHTERV